jgi:hypothetical protein
VYGSQQKVLDGVKTNVEVLIDIHISCPKRFLVCCFSMKILAPKIGTLQMGSK